MKKAVVKSKAKAKSAKPAKRTRSRKPKKAADIAEVRKEITGLVAEAAPALTVAVVEEGRKGQLAPVKYLFEMAGLYPPAGGVQEKPEEAALAKTLLDRLGLSHESATAQEDDAASKINVGADQSGSQRAQDEEVSGNSGSQSENQDADAMSQTRSDSEIV